MRSTTRRRTASRSVIETAWRTAFSAQSALRPRSSATVRMNAAASFSIFFSIVLSVFPPPSMTGDAAPMLVAGAIAAMWAASVMKTPAEAARAPVGATKMITGTSAFNIRWTITRMDRSSPPGVSSWMMSAWARSLLARSIASPTRRSVTGLITPSMSIFATGAGAAPAPRARAAPRAPGARARPSFAQRQEAHDLEHEIRREERRDLAGAVVERRDLHDVGPDEGLPGERAHERERLVRGEPADLGRAGGGCVGGVYRVDVEGAVDRSAPEPAEPLAHPGDPLLLHHLDADHLDPVPLVEREVVGAVEGAADAHLDHAARVHEPLLDGPTERRPVEELGAEVLVPGVRMRVEVDETDGPVPARERSQDRQRDGVVAANH